MGEQKIKISVNQYGRPVFTAEIALPDEDEIEVTEVPAGALRGFPNSFDIQVETVKPEAEDTGKTLGDLID